MSDPRIEDFATQLSIRDNAIAQLAMTNVCNNAYVRYVAAVLPIDGSTMEIEHGALELLSSFEFPLNSQETQSRELYISPSQKKYYTQQPGRFFSLALEIFLISSPHPTRTHGFGTMDLPAWDECIVPVQNPNTGDQDWFGELSFETKAKKTTLVSLQLTHDPEKMPNFIGRLLREAIQIETNRLTTVAATLKN